MSSRPVMSTRAHSRTGFKATQRNLSLKTIKEKKYIVCFIVANAIGEMVPRLLVSMRVITESQNMARSLLRDFLNEDTKWLSLNGSLAGMVVYARRAGTHIHRGRKVQQLRLSH